MKRKYTNPPVVEASCEFRFGPESAWDIRIPGLLFERVRASFPAHQVAAPTADARMGGIPQPSRVRFFRGDGKAFLQLGPNTFGVHHLQPYTSWPFFLRLIEEGYAAYRDIAEPAAVEAMELRYANRFSFPGSCVDLRDHFNVRPHGEIDLAHDCRSFSMTIAFPFEEGRDTLTIDLRNAGPKRPGTLSVALDIAYTMDQANAVPPGGIFSWLNAAHERISQAFEGTIKEKLRAMFGEMTE